ncbi:MAG: hypothetical protein MZW92_34100 [Comamonadaceae bacterium]|nr:hypothetical protein [Comamonadaceae bacterium]
MPPNHAGNPRATGCPLEELRLARCSRRDRCCTASSPERNRKPFECLRRLPASGR